MFLCWERSDVDDVICNTSGELIASLSFSLFSILEKVRRKARGKVLYMGERNLYEYRKDDYFFGF